MVRRRLMADASQVVFMQDGASLHTAQKSQHWCAENPPCFWGRVVWPENSLDLKTTENLWASPQEKGNKMTSATTVDELMKQLNRAWRDIQPCAGEPGGGDDLADA